MILKLKRTPGIYLAGFMGSGKTTVGERVADQLGWHFVDLDGEIVRSEGRSIAEIFDSQGEPAFREIERTMLRKRVRMVQSGVPSVVALGGGAFDDEGSRKLMSENGVCIWLDCPWERIVRRVAGEAGGAVRPLARDPKRFEELYHVRRAVYSQCDYRVEADTDDAGAVAQLVLDLPLFA